ncbi:MAG: hypothetical protein ACK4F9_03505, partial [Brevinematia bacterium]
MKQIIYFTSIFLTILIILTYCSPSPSTDSRGSDGRSGGGSGGGGGDSNISIPTFTISGKLTGSPSSQWKVAAEYFQNFTPLYIYGTVNTSTWDYTISVPSNTYVERVIAFKDNNNNNKYDLGESSVSTNITI